ncbi:hypothetical protein [Parafrigoribacterium soli]|uniref:hypothetical protein n=1 Tax=Parafrigoribacterium soli TaxID=3144663 RepID=UPI0032EB672E
MTEQLAVAGGQFSIVLPGTWSTIPLDDDAALEGHIKRLVLKQVGRADRFARTRREVRDQLTDVALNAKAQGAITFAIALELLPGVPFPASLMISEDTWPPDVELLALENLEQKLRVARPAAEVHPFRSGPVARIASVTDVSVGEETTPQLSAQYWVPAADGTRLFRVFVEAPMAQFPELLTELFDSIVDSMVWLADEESTTTQEDQR